MLPTIILLFNAFKISCVKLNIAFSVDKFLLKPNCWGFNKLLIFRWSINLLYNGTLRTETCQSKGTVLYLLPDIVYYVSKQRT